MTTSDYHISLSSLVQASRATAVIYLSVFPSSQPGVQIAGIYLIVGSVDTLLFIPCHLAASFLNGINDIIMDIKQTKKHML